MDSRILKVIVAVAALHVLVLGSMFLIQHGCRKGPTDSSVARAEPAPPLPPAAPNPPPPGGVQSLPTGAYTPPSPGTPTATPAPPLPPPSAPTTKVYTIKQGDTLGKIAKLENVSVTDLTTANPKVDPKKLRIGQEIQIPVSGSTTAHAPTPSTLVTERTEGAAPPATPTTYTVRKGDTLAKIAKAQGTTVVALKKANRLTSDTIQVGQKLKIPTPAESGQRPPRESASVAAASSGAAAMSDPNVMTHTVQPAETPAIIAKKYGVSTKALLEANGNLNPKRLKIGQKLIIPGKKTESAAPEPGTSPVTPVPPADETTSTNAPDSGAGISGAAIAPPTSTTPAETPAPAPAR